MDIRQVFGILGYLLLAVGIAMLTAIPISLAFETTDLSPLLLSSSITASAGIFLSLLKRKEAKDLHIREGFAIVTLGWIFIPLFGSLPYMMSGVIPSFTDAYFESVSGFTTTGASILRDVEALPHGILYWRSLTHWIGGMGIIILYLAILPMMKFGAIHLFKAEVSGLTKDKLTPRVADTARILWGVYCLLTVSEFILLGLGGMPWFDALCHSFGTVATGGFSTKNASIGFYHSTYIDTVVTVFMLLAATNFALHYTAIKGNPRAYFSSDELKFFLLLYAASVAIIALANQDQLYGGSFLDALRYSMFNVASIMSCTGFATADFAAWVPLAQHLLILLMFIGGCAGSTAGGIKVARILIVLKAILTFRIRLLHPRAVAIIRFDDKSVDEDLLIKIGAFIVLYFGIFLFSAFLLMSLNIDPLSSVTSVASCLAGIGPGLNKVGPMSNYAHLPSLAKWILDGCMLLGRLEIFTALVLFSPSFWKK